MSAVSREPAVTIGTVVSLVTAVGAMLVAFGVNLTAEQIAAVGAVVAAVGPIAGLVIRRYVTPTGGEHRAGG